MDKAAARRASADAMVRTEIPELFQPGTWIVLSTGISFPTLGRPQLHMVVELNEGACLAARFGPAPLGRQVAALLDGLLFGGHCHVELPARVVTDNKKDVDLGKLAAWGAARGVHTGFHPACTLHPNAHAVMLALATLLNRPDVADAMERGALADVGAQVEAWRHKYNENRCA
ncbi:hypothetical protein [Cupriavidus sp. CP313]